MSPQKAATAALFCALRERLNLSPERAALYLGVPLYTYKKWESAERVPSASVLRLLDVLGTIEALAPSLHDHFLPPVGEPKVACKRGRPLKTKTD